MNFLQHPHSNAKPINTFSSISTKHLQSKRAVFVSCRAQTQNIFGQRETDNPNYYKLLSLSPNNASVDEIKKAYRNLALRYHPDVCDFYNKEESTRMFVRVNEAYKTLSDPVLRREYDFELDMMGYGKMKMNVAQRNERKTVRKEQVTELKRRPSKQTTKMGEGSWACRVRSQRLRNED